VLPELAIAELQSVMREVQDPEVRESLVDIVVSAQDTVGWKLLAGFDRDTGPTAEEIHNTSQNARVFLAGNPLAKRAVKLRTGYVWGGGVDFGRSRGIKPILERNEERFFSIDAYEAFESTLATDGNYFTLLNASSKKMTLIPLAEITGWIADPDDATHVLYWQRTWVRIVTDDKGESKRTTMKRYIPAHDNTETRRSRIGDIEVDDTSKIHHTYVNRQEGWVLGLPDLFPVLLWIDAYRRFIEGGQSVNQALTRFAWKIVGKTKAGAQRAAASIATAPGGADYVGPGGTLANPDSGATASLTGMELAAVGKTGAMIDFEAARPIAALVAAGMEVPLDAILASVTQNGETALDKATVDAMRIRQAKADASYTRRLKVLGVPNPKVTFPPVRSLPPHRVVQAYAVAAATGTLSPRSVHNGLGTVLAELGYVDDGVLPEPGEWNEFAKGGADNPGTPPLNTPNGDNTNTDGRGPADDVGDGGNDVRNDS